MIRLVAGILLTTITSTVICSELDDEAWCTPENIVTTEINENVVIKKCISARLDRSIDLSNSGEMSKIENNHPLLFKKIQDILNNVGNIPAPEVTEWLRVTYGAKNSAMYSTWYVSYPPES